MSERPKHEAYTPGERQRDKERREQNAWRWLDHHTRQLRSVEHTYKILAAHHKQQVARYRAVLGLDKENAA